MASVLLGSSFHTDSKFGFNSMYKWIETSWLTAETDSWLVESVYRRDRATVPVQTPNAKDGLVRIKDILA